MTTPTLKCRASLAKLQRAAAKYYLLLQQHFAGNSLVGETWGMMANDWLAQTASLRKLPAPFWYSLKKEQTKLARSAESLISPYSNLEVGGLTACLAHTFETEEPIVLNIYAPLIRHLRTAWTDMALDFYVVVKVHIVRLARLIQMYAGDPALNQRCSVLLLNLEKEIQKPNEGHADNPAKPARRRAAAVRRHEKTVAGRHRSSAAKVRSGRIPDRRPKRTKPLVKKIEIARRRVRR